MHLRGKRMLVMVGAGFIGSHLVDELAVLSLVLAVVDIRLFRRWKVYFETRL